MTRRRLPADWRLRVNICRLSSHLMFATIAISGQNSYLFGAIAYSDVAALTIIQWQNSILSEKYRLTGNWIATEETRNFSKQCTVRV